MRSLAARLRFATVCVWYRYPSDVHPRVLTVSVDTDASIGDAVACAIANDRGWPAVADSSTPAQTLLDLLHAHPDADAHHALAYAAIAPPPYRAAPPLPSSRKRGAAPSQETNPRANRDNRARRAKRVCRVASPAVA